MYPYIDMYIHIPHNKCVPSHLCFDGQLSIYTGSAYIYIIYVHVFIIIYNTYVYCDIYLYVHICIIITHIYNIYF